jgi:hypothetical protein
MRRPSVLAFCSRLPTPARPYGIASGPLVGDPLPHPEVSPSACGPTPRGPFGPTSHRAMEVLTRRRRGRHDSRLGRRHIFQTHEALPGHRGASCHWNRGLVRRAIPRPTRGAPREACSRRRLTDVARVPVDPISTPGQVHANVLEVRGARGLPQPLRLGYESAPQMFPALIS